MNLQFHLEKLFASEEFEKFLKEKPEAYFCSGFFCVDKKGTDNKTHIDYYVPSENKIFSFQLESKIEPMPVDVLDKKVFEKIPDNIDFSFEGIEKMIEDKITEEKINSKVEKILLSLQRLDGKDFLVGTIFVSGLGMIKIKIDLNENHHGRTPKDFKKKSLQGAKITEFEKKSFFEMLKVMKK